MTVGPGQARARRGPPTTLRFRPRSFGADVPEGPLHPGYGSAYICDDTVDVTVSANGDHWTGN
jgi:hypothetical protein